MNVPENGKGWESCLERRPAGQLAREWGVGCIGSGLSHETLA